MVTINFHKRDLFIVAAIAVFIVGCGVVIAWGSNNPPVMGHTLNEIDASACANNQIIKKVNGAWSCGDDNSGGLPSCGANQILKTNASGNWVCNNTQGRIVGGCEINCEGFTYRSCGTYFGSGSCNGNNGDSCAGPELRCNCPANALKWYVYQSELFSGYTGNLVLCLSND